MSRYSPYLRRLQRLEPEPEYVEPWPPEEGSLSWCLFLECDPPVERMGFMEMYYEVARRTFAEDET